MSTDESADLTVTQVQVYSLWDEKSHQRLYRIQLAKEETEESAQAMRELATVSNDLGKVIALVVAVIGSVLLALVHWPNTAHMLRWPGVVLALAGQSP